MGPVVPTIEDVEAFKAKEFFQSLPLKVEEDPVVMGLLGDYQLAAPMSFWEAEDELIAAVVGGCGPGGAGDMLVPDTIYLLKVTLACKIHDWCFAVWNDDAGFKKANDIFKNNLLRIIEQHGSWCKALHFLRKKRAITYYKAVRHFGKPSFFDSHKRLV